jgi:hypothetical protein
VIKGLEAISITVLMLFVESLQINIKAAMKRDEDSHDRLIPLTETVNSSQILLYASSGHISYNHSCHCIFLNILILTCRF